MERMKVAGRIALLCIGLASAGLASAATGLSATGIACDGHGTELTSQVGFIACSGSWSGNNLNQATAIESWAKADWGLDLTSMTALTAGAGAHSGVLTFAPQTGRFVISLKVGDAFSLYEFDGSSVAGGIHSIDFDTLGVGFQSGRKLHYDLGLSHADLYSGGTTSSVPEPGSALLLLAGVGALAFVARRKVR
jgi:hypothetical protein